MKRISPLSLLGVSCSLLIDGIAAPVCTETRCDATNERLLLQCESNEDNVGVIHRIDCSTPDEGQTVCQDDLLDESIDEIVSGCTLCGDGLLDLDSFEQCDDGDNNRNDACIVSNTSGAPLCTIAVCGDGFVFDQEGGTEECDDGNNNNTDACTNSCEDARCGDNFTQPVNGEECDDGNASNTDTCTNACENARCGDGFRQTSNGEECDDGDSSNRDACTNQCKDAVCGDGFVFDQGGGTEECDDGNNNNNDSCNNNCRRP